MVRRDGKAGEEYPPFRSPRQVGRIGNASNLPVTAFSVQLDVENPDKITRVEEMTAIQEGTFSRQANRKYDFAINAMLRFPQEIIRSLHAPSIRNSHARGGVGGNPYGYEKSNSVPKGKGQTRSSQSNRTGVAL